MTSIKKQRKTTDQIMPDHLQMAEKTFDRHFHKNIKTLKGLEMMSGYKDTLGMSSYKSFELTCLGLPLKRLGLFLKPQYGLGDDYDEEEELQQSVCTWGQKREESCDDQKKSTKQLEKESMLRTDYYEFIRKERERVRMEISQVEKSAVDLQESISSLRELEKLCGCRDTYGDVELGSSDITCLGLPLKQLGLFLKSTDYSSDEEEDLETDTWFLKKEKQVEPTSREEEKEVLIYAKPYTLPF